jgi:uncharacterized protein involved in exopolysaccharide biosynthesis
METDYKVDARSILKTAWKRNTVGVFLVAGLLGAALVTWLWPVSFDTEMSIFLNRSNMQKSEDYRYGGFYELGASEYFSEVIAKMFQSPSVVREIWERSNFLKEKKLGSLKRFFRSEAVSVQQVEVKFKTDKEEEARLMSEKAFAVVEEKVDEINQMNQKDAYFALIKTDPVIVKSEVYWWLNFIIGLGGGLILGVLSVIFIESLKRDENRDRS